MEEFNLSNTFYDKNSEPMSVKDWLITMLLMMIPLANIVLMFIWAFGSDVNISKKNFFRANLILSAIILGLYLVIFIFIVVISLIATSSLLRI